MRRLLPSSLGPDRSLTESTPFISAIDLVKTILGNNVVKTAGFLRSYVPSSEMIPKKI